MDNIKQYVYDVVEGRVTVPEFLEACNEHPEILDWIQSVIPSDLQGAELIEDDSVLGGVRLVSVQYNVRNMLRRYEQWREMRGELSYQYNVFGEIAKVMRFAFPDSPPKEDQTLSDLFNTILRCCPSYIDGSEVWKSGILEEIIHSIPKELSKTAGQKWAKERIKERFHIKGRHYPYWIQGPEWPMMDGEPMEYVRTVRHSIEGQTHYFRDPKTGEERAVEDFH